MVSTIDNINGSSTDGSFTGMLASPAVLNPSKEHETGKHCTYRNCRHTAGQHGKSFKDSRGKSKRCRCKHFTPPKEGITAGEIIDSANPEYRTLVQVLDSIETFCDCGEPRRGYDVVQTYQTNPDGKRIVWTYHHCPKCKYDLAAWKIARRVTKPQFQQLKQKGVFLYDQFSWPEAS